VLFNWLKPQTFCILNKTAGNLCARKTELSAEETSFEEDFGCQEEGGRKSIVPVNLF